VKKITLVNLVTTDAIPTKEAYVAYQRLAQFQGDILLVACSHEGHCYVSIASICEALQIHHKGQIQRIKRSEFLLRYLYTLSLETPGGRQNVACLQVDGIAPWLEGLRLKQASDDQIAKCFTYRQQLSSRILAYFASKPDAMAQQAEPIILKPEVQTSLLPMRQSDHSPLPYRGIDARETEKMLSLITSLPASETVSSHLTISVSNVDQSIREATFADEAAWELIENTRVFSASNDLQVYLGTPELPLSVDDAQEKIRQLGGSTILTARIAMGLWNIRRHDQRFSINGSVAVGIDEILAWKGIQKHARSAYATAVKHPRTDGYRAAQKQQVLDDLELRASCCVRGQCVVEVQQKHRTVKKTILIDSAYWRYSVVHTQDILQQSEVVGVFISPGDWILTYESYSNDFFTEIDRKVFGFHPQSEQHELRIALYLIERWRQQPVHAPISMEMLLEKSMITPNTNNMARFASRIEDALEKLCRYGILGTPPICATPVDKSQARWARKWLSSQWYLVPPETVNRQRIPTREVVEAVRENRIIGRS
jgi:hypothetical protein